MDNSIKKYLEDILHAISDIEMAEERFNRQYDYPNPCCIEAV